MSADRGNPFLAKPRPAALDNLEVLPDRVVSRHEQRTLRIAVDANCRRPGPVAEE